MSDTQPTKRGSTRTKARKRALDLLFEAELRELAVADVLAAHTERAEPPVRPFTATLVTGVAENREEFDAMISAHLPSGWTIERMPRVDRNLARLAIYELTRTDTDAAVVLAEAVALAGDLSTDESPAFLNGVLGSVSRSLASTVS